MIKENIFDRIFTIKLAHTVKKKSHINMVLSFILFIFGSRISWSKKGFELAT